MNDQQATTNCEASMEMPKYRCHKIVSAVKIQSLELDREIAEREGRETDGGARIVPEEYPLAPFRVDSEYVRKHKPEVGGYFVVYQDGYKSFSPKKAFEDGYTKI